MDIQIRLDYDKEDDYGFFGVELPNQGRIGRLTFYIENKKVEICDLWLEVDYRHQGIGSKLITCAINLAHELNCKELHLMTQYDDYPVHEFYKKHGFIETHVEKGSSYFKRKL